MAVITPGCGDVVLVRIGLVVAQLLRLKDPADGGVVEGCMGETMGKLYAASWAVPAGVLFRSDQPGGTRPEPENHSEDGLTWSALPAPRTMDDSRPCDGEG